jgi:hypothetical protein
MWRFVTGSEISWIVPQLQIEAPRGGKLCVT